MASLFDNLPSGSSGGVSSGTSDSVGRTTVVAGDMYSALIQAVATTASSLIAADVAKKDRKAQQNENQLNRDFNSQEAALSREFNAAEAEKARQFTLDFYDRFQSPSALVNQYKDAGLNPAMMMSGGASSSGSGASGSAASSTPASASASPLPTLSSGLASVASSFGTLMQMVRSAQLMSAEKREIDSRNLLNLSNAAKANAETIGVQLVNQYTPQMKDAELRNLQVQADAALSTIALNESTVALNDNQQKLIQAKILTESDMQAHYKALVRTQDEQVALMKFNEALLKAQEESVRKGMVLTDAQIKEVAVRTGLESRQIEQVEAIVEKTNAEIRNLGLNAKILEQDEKLRSEQVEGAKLSNQKSEATLPYDIASVKVGVFNQLCTKVGLPLDVKYYNKRAKKVFNLK